MIDKILNMDKLKADYGIAALPKNENNIWKENKSTKWNKTSLSYNKTI
jgi:hypothetical protein